MSRISKRTVDEMVLPASAKARAYLWDDRLKGFGVMATATGAKSFIVQYRLAGSGGSTRRVTIGRYGSPWTAETARDRAADLLELVRRKVDPFDAERASLQAASAAKVESERSRHARERLAFSTYADLYLERHASVRQKARTAKETRRIIERDLKPHFRDATIVSITPTDILALVDLTYERSPSASLKVYRTLSSLFGWAGSRHDLVDNPMRNLKPPYLQPSRDRVLSDREICEVWQTAAATPYPYGPLIQMLIVTGQRLDEVASMTWNEVDFGERRWTVPANRAKKENPSVVPLTNTAVEIFQRTARLGRYVFTTKGKVPFSGFSKAKKRFDVRMAARFPVVGDQEIREPWRIHDLRRTLATGLQKLGVRLEVTEAVLNHVAGSRAGIVGIYQRYNYADEKRTVLESWSAYLQRLLTAYTAAPTVTPPIRRAAPAKPRKATK